ncbi:MAG: energy-coupling factor transporter transmembrane protein EcfT [Caldilineaceae bacterium]|nr:energy-coupling factor transporter transmembrane protein EcfT [Caldilineaceae bacterium]
MQEFELSRNIVVGQYMPTGSYIHRLDPRTKIVAALCMALALSSVRSLIGSSLLLIGLLLVARGARLSSRFILRGLLPALAILLVLFVLQLWFQGWREPSERIYLEWRFIRITRVSVHLIGLGVIRVLAFLFLFSLLTMTTTATHLTHGLEMLLAPLRRVGVPVQEIAMVNMISIRFVPTLVDELERIMKAQASRGGAVGLGGGWNPIRLARTRLPLIVPLFLNALQRAEELVLAMEARGYRGGATRTRYAQFHLTTVDALVMAGVALFCWLIWWTPWPPLYRFFPML